MARRKAINLEEQDFVPATTPDAALAEGETPTRRRRRRRTTAASAPDYVQETTILVEAALKSRGSRGATMDILQSVVIWARGVRTEGDELRLLSSRPRRLKTQASNDRLLCYEVNRALLDGVLSGDIILDLQENGSLAFVHSVCASDGPYFESETGGLPTLVVPSANGSN